MPTRGNVAVSSHFTAIFSASRIRSIFCVFRYFTVTPCNRKKSSIHFIKKYTQYIKSL